MTLILCLDQKDGMLFNKRRQTFDYELLDMICKSFKGKLFISSFSEKYFGQRSVTVLSSPLTDAPSESAVFIENEDVTPFIGNIDKIIIYRFGCVYPADTYFTVKPLESGFRLAGRIKFSTEVHKDMFKEIYKR